MKRAIRWIATVLHIGVILLGVYVIVDNPSRSTEILISICLVLGATLTLIAIWSSPSRTFLGLYFERRRLEERAKIERLESDED